MPVRLTVIVLVVGMIAVCLAGPVLPDGTLARPKQPRDDSAGRAGVQPPDPRSVDPPRSGWRPRPGWNRDRPHADVPEAGTLILVGLGLLVLPVLLRRRRPARR